MRNRKLTRGVLYLRSKSSKDASSPAFTSSINWTSVLAMACTVYQTRLGSESCGNSRVSTGYSFADKPFVFNAIQGNGGSGLIEPAGQIEVVVEIVRRRSVFR